MTTRALGGRRPLLRWAGGKRWLVPLVAKLVGNTEIANYHEPFMGGAAMYFGLEAGHSHAFLSDLNADLVSTYREVRDHPEEVWRFLRTHKNTESHYYAARASRPRLPASLAARFIYLNHASFNGIYRVNLAGRYNVPYGYRTSFLPPQLTDLQAASKRLACSTLADQDFACALTAVGNRDLVFLDPPYTVAHNFNGFVKYNNKLFSFADQVRLGEAIDEVRARGAYYILTNAAHRSISELFERGENRIETHRKNVIGGLAANRGSAAEYLFTNLPTA